jgi:hypothetical protein
MLPNEYRPGTTHTLSATTSSGATRTSAFGAQTQTVMVTSTAGVFVAFGATPTAATSSTFIAADYPLTFRVEGGDTAAAITGTSTATVYVTELSR